MMQQILNQLQNQLKPLSIPVYLAYDHVPAQTKAAPFLVLNVQSWKTELPVQRAEQLTIPFSATLTLTLLLPLESNAAELLRTFVTELLPALMQDGIHTSLLSEPKTDRLLNRRTMTATCTISGVLQPEVITTTSETEES